MILDGVLALLWMVSALVGAMPGERYEWLFPPVLAAAWCTLAGVVKARYLVLPRHTGGLATAAAITLAGSGFALATNSLKDAVLPACSIAVAAMFLMERRSALQGHLVVLASFVVAVVGASADTQSKLLPVFAPFLFLLVVALALVHQQWVLQRLRRAAHEGYMLAAQVPGFAGTRTGLAPSVALVVAVTAMATIALYVAIPHYRYRRAGQLADSGSGEGSAAASGIAEEMTLRGVRELKMDRRVALRAIVTDNGSRVKPTLPLRLRGGILEKCETGRWIRDTAQRVISDDEDGRRDGWVTLIDTPRRPVTLDVSAEPHGRILFSLGQAASIRGNRFVVGDSGEVNLADMPTSRFGWTMTCEVALPDPTTYEDNPEAPGLIYLQLPRRDERILALSREVTQGLGTAFEKARAISGFLSTQFDYTLEVDPSDDPVHSLLFEQKAGYCVHFAATMAVMLRHLGIPCRIVQGLYGGEWSEREALTLFRLSDAHAWVEVWLGPEAGWIGFDPTPAEAAPVEEPGDFSLGTAPPPPNAPEAAPPPARLAPRNLGRVNIELQRRWLNALMGWLEAVFMSRIGRGACLSVLFIGSLIITWRLLPRHERSRIRAALLGVDAAELSFYDEFLTLSRRAGYIPARGETPYEFSQRVEGAYPGASQVATAYYAVRFGGEAPAGRAAEVRPILDGIRSAQAGKARKPEPKK